MDFKILGMLEARSGGRRIPVDGPKQRGLLALLLLHANEPLPAERLIYDLWGERPPASAAKSLQMVVSRLRRTLVAGAVHADPPSVPETRSGGYMIRLDPDQLDLSRFERRAIEGRTLLAAGQPGAAASQLAAALEEWHGAALADLAFEPFAQTQVARLEELRVAVLEDRIEADLASGRHAAVVAEIEALVAAHPFRERLREQLMLALYRAGRQADALQAYQDTRRTLVEELGIEPGEGLRELERAILEQDRALAPPAASSAVGDGGHSAGESAAPLPGADELPSGVVTFLLTDIEGSSGLWEADAEAMAAALELHDGLIADTVSAHGGRLLKAKGEGDATLTVFRRASDAVAGAVELQNALAGASWPGGLDVRVRVALHTGEAHERAGDYFGPALNRAARLRSLTRGGATVLSQATTEIVHDRLPPDVELVDLGRQQLRGLARPENPFELRATHGAGLANESALDVPRTTGAGKGDAPDGLRAPPTAPVPAPLTRTIGREAERSAVAKLLRRDEIRLVTLTGAGGVGKTRLAVEVARLLEPEFRDGAWFVELAAIAEPEHAESAIAKALSLTPLPGEAPADALARFLAPREALLVLDNFEHLLSAAPLVSRLLAQCDALKVLATSRAALRVQPEHRVLVEPLGLPVGQKPADVERSAAGALFIDRTNSVGASFPVDVVNAGAIAGLCRRLDGLPLAIELAAARTTVLDPEELSTRLARALDVLGSGPRDAPDRQRTLRATIEWSYRLLNAAEAATFDRFAVFAGGATLEAAQAITGADLDALEGLVDKQLLSRRGSGPDVRLLMLETVREYARERLDADENDAVETHRRHCLQYIALVERAEPDLYTRSEALWLRRLDAEVDNIRAALDWSLRDGDPTLALRLAGLLALFWEIRHAQDEGLEWLAAALDATGDRAPIGDRARASRAQVRLLVSQGAAYDWKGSAGRARARATEALALSRRAGDPAGVADALLAAAGLEMVERHPQRRRHALAREALQHAREAGHDRLVAFALEEEALALRPDQAAAELERAAAALRKIGSTRLLTMFYFNAGYNAIKAGGGALARSLLDQAVPLARELGDPVLLAFVAGNVGLEALFADDPDRARRAFDEQLRVCGEHLLYPVAAEGLAGLAAIASKQGDPDRAARLLGAATATGPVGDADVEAELDQRFFAEARDSLGKRRWDDAHTAGMRLSFEEAIDYALNPDATPSCTDASAAPHSDSAASP